MLIFYLNFLIFLTTLASFFIFQPIKTLHRRRPKPNQDTEAFSLLNNSAYANDMYGVIMCTTIWKIANYFHFKVILRRTVLLLETTGGHFTPLTQDQALIKITNEFFEYY